ncbi:MAG: hypothetical protein JO081_14405 [Alphaproteobacteria bacterium]|nr:hypothetical protein [Alphaproteobacteria bacterium]
MINREAIYSTLWTLASRSAQYATANRRLRHWSDVSPAEQPALFMSEKGGTGIVKTRGTPVVWTLYVDFYIYAHSTDIYTPPASILNPLIDALEAALGPVNPVAGLWQNLGLPDMVQHTYVTGRVETDEGILGDQAVAIVPVEIVCV